MKRRLEQPPGLTGAGKGFNVLMHENRDHMVPKAAEPPIVKVTYPTFVTTVKAWTETNMALTAIKSVEEAVRNL